MKLTDITRAISNTAVREANLIHLERYVNDAKGNFKDYSEVSVRYSPEQGERYFNVPYKWVSMTKLHIFRSNPTQRLEDEVVVNGQARFIWHPEMPSPFESNPDGYYQVCPTSSTRTLFTRELPYNFMVKTDLDKKHFRFRRRLKGRSVEHSTRISRDISDSVATGMIPFYGYLPESLGFVYGDKTNGTGVLFREIEPCPLISEPRNLIPYFSLYSRDTFFLQDTPLLIELIEHNSHYDPLGFFVNIIVGLIQDTWVYFVKERGILPELHGQNILLEINAEGIPKRLIHRDFQSIYSDMKIREAKGLPQFEKHIIGVEDNITQHQQYSLIFDHLISRYLLERMIRVFIEYYPKYSFGDMAQHIAHRFRNIPGNVLEVFPIYILFITLSIHK